MKNSIFTIVFVLITASITNAGVSVDWVHDGTATGTWSAIDKNDNVFVTSWDGSIWLRKYDQFGNFQWEVNYTTPLIFNYLYPSRVHTDSTGNVTVVGYRYTNPTEGREANAVVVLKYDQNGNMLWEHLIDGIFSFWNNSSFRTNVSSVTDASDNLYIGTAGNVTGYATTGFNTIKITPTGTIAWVSAKNISGGTYHFVSNIRMSGNRIALAGHTEYWLANAVVWVLDINGVSKWSKTEAGIGGSDALIDPTGKVYLLTSSEPGYDSDISLYRYKPNGTFQWNKLFDFGGAEIGYRMMMSPDNRIVMQCYGNQTGISLYVDWLTIKISLNGTQLWYQRYDTHGNNDEIPSHMAIDTDGDIFVTGIGGPFPGGPNLGARQFVVVKYRSNGTQQWAYAQDTINEYQSGRHIDIDSRGNIFVAVDISSLTYHFIDYKGTEPCNIPTGITVSDITEESAVISWDSVTNAYLYHVQYKTPASDIWTSISTDQTSATLTDLFSGTTYQYHVEAICTSGPTGYSDVATFVALGAGYCTSGGIDATGDFIDLVYVNDLLNSTLVSDGGYNDFTYLSANLTKGTTYSFTLSAGIPGGLAFEYWNVWIDYNGDADFTDAGENIVSYSSDQIGWESHNFTVPMTATVGNTIMRVVMKRGSAATSCETFAKGETEDYTVNILPAREGEATTVAAGGMKLFPNPANKFINVQLENMSPEVILTIFDFSGKQISLTKTDSQTTQLNIEELPAGVYILVAADELGNRVISKFIKN